MLGRITLWLGLLAVASSLLAAPNAIILPENAASLIEVARFGQGRATNALFSPNGDLLAVASSIGVWLYDANDLNTPPTLLEGHTGVVTSLAFNPDGQVLASASADQTIRLWNVESHAETAVLRGHKGAIYSVAFDSVGTLLASAGGDGIRLWDLSENNRSTLLEGHTGWVQHVAFQPGGTWLASSTDDYNDPLRVRLWDVNTASELPPPDERLGGAPVTFSPGGTLLVFQKSDALQLWDVRSQTTQLTLPGYSFVDSLAFSPDGALLAVGSWGKIDLIEVSSGSKHAELRTFDFPVLDLSFSPDGKRLANINSGQVQVWDLTANELEITLDGYYGDVQDVAFNPDGTLLASAHGTFLDCRPLQVWEVASASHFSKVNSNGCQEAAAFSPGGTLVVDGYDNDYGALLRLQDTKTNSEISILSRLFYSLYSLAFTFDGRLLAAAGETNAGSNNTGYVVQVWDVESGEELLQLNGPGRAVTLTFSPDGRLLAYNQSVIIHLWDMENAVEAATLEGHEEEVTSLAFSPHEDLLASCAYDGKLRLWNTDTFSQTAVIDSCVDGLAFSPDGRLLAYGSGETIRLLEVDTGMEIAALRGHTELISALAFSADGTQLASGAWDGTVRLWAVDNE